MKINKNGISSLILAAAMLMTALLPMGCSSKEAKIKAQLNDLAETFIADFASGDKDKMEDLVEGRFDYQISYAKQSKILLKIASKTEIDEIVSFEVDQKEGKARLRTKLSYIDIYEFGKDKENRNISVEECMANVDTYKNRSTTNYTFNFVLDDDGNWKIRNVAAERYEELFNHQYVLSV